MKVQILNLRFWILSFAVLLFTFPSATAATYRDELTFLGRTTYLFRDYSLVVPLDIKRQQIPGEVFIEIKAWGAWNGSWVPYIYEPADLPGAMADDLNSIIARYRQIKGDTRLNVHKGKDNSFALNYDKERTRFELETKGFVPRAVRENPEGRLMLGVTDARLSVNGHAVAGRVASVFITPGGRSDSTGRYGLYDHFTLQLPSGAILVVNHSRTRPAFNFAALLTLDGKGDVQGERVQASWQKLWRDVESGREIPTAWTVQAPELGVKADLEEWGRNLVRYKTDAGKTAVFVNVMVRGSVEVGGNRMKVFGLNTHVQDD
jgi:hypothetical protein